MRNIALVGPQRAGKSTLAMMLMARQGYECMGIADEIKLLAGKAYHAFDKHDTYTVRSFSGEEQQTGREILQQIGAALRGVDRDFWLKCFTRKFVHSQKMGNHVVIDDVRLDREVAYLRHLDPKFVVVLVTASPLVREKRAGGSLVSPDDLTEIAWRGIEPDFTLDTSDLEAHDAFEQLLRFLEER